MKICSSFLKNDFFRCFMHYFESTKISNRYIHIAKELNCERSNTLRTNFNKISRYNSKYNNDEMLKILKKLNGCTFEELSNYAISKVCLKRILEKRQLIGEFKSVNDVLNIDGLGIKALEKMCDSILNQPIMVSDVKKPDYSRKKCIKGQILDPVLTNDKLQSLESSCALCIDINLISWARIDRRNNQLTDWKTHKFDVVEGKSLKLSNIMEIVWSVCKEIPQSDVYILEAAPNVMRSMGADVNNPKSVHINIQKVQLLSITTAAITFMANFQPMKSKLSNLEDFHNGQQNGLYSLPEYENKVFFLRAMLASRLFRTFIGNEKVSPQFVVTNILDTSCKSSGSNQIKYEKVISVLENITPLCIDDDIKNYYFNQRDFDKEILSQTLLLIVTFMELCVYQNLSVLKNLDFNQ